MDEQLAHQNHLNLHHAMMRRHMHGDHDFFADIDLPTPVATAQPSKIVGRDITPTGTCTDTTSPGCKLPEAASNNTATIIGVSVAIPLALAVIVLVVLHRRTTKRQAAEDLKDAQADLDFGIDPKYKNMPTRKKVGGKKGGAPEMTVADMGFEKSLRNGHGTGMSIDLGNPYILPAEVNSSRDSLHSLTRSLTDSQDPYRMVGPKTPSMRGFNDAGSIRSGSDRGLLANPQPISMSRQQSPLAPHSGTPPSIHRKDTPGSQGGDAPVNMPTFDFTDHSATDARPGHASHVSHASHASHPSQVDVRTANRMSNPDKSLPATPQGALQSPPARGDSLNKTPYGATNNAGPVDPYSFQEIVVPPSPTAESRQNAGAAEQRRSGEPYNAATFPHPPPPEPTAENRKTLGLGLDLAAGNRLSVLRPLPPDDPNDSAETRANRIRSFYKEYFADDSAHTYDAGGTSYYEDYGDEYLQDGAVFDPETGQFIVAQAPYAAPVTRRAMTPPPRGPPQNFRAGPRRPGHASQGSSPAVGGPRSRAFSNASYNRMGPDLGPRGRAANKRPLPPPAALANLPSPFMLQKESFDMLTDFAPGVGVRDRAAGRSNSLTGGDQPYQLRTPIAKSPLAGTSHELQKLAMPHAFDENSMLTDLLPPPKPRFMDGDSGSDAGSIRSGRSNFSTSSARQQHNIRAGAYRLSRVPKDLVGTQKEFMESLKPQWKMGA